MSPNSLTHIKTWKTIFFSRRQFEWTLQAVKPCNFYLFSRWTARNVGTKQYLHFSTMRSEIRFGFTTVVARWRRKKKSQSWLKFDLKKKRNFEGKKTNGRIDKSLQFCFRWKIKVCQNSMNPWKEKNGNLLMLLCCNSRGNPIKETLS